MGLLLKCFVNKIQKPSRFSIFSKIFFISLTICFLPFVSSAKDQFNKKKISINGKTLVVEIAETSQQHELGLMFREKLGEDEGMLFVFKNAETRFFWMKNTLIDLSIAYFDKEGKLIDVQEMKSGKGLPDHKLPNYPSLGPAKYALEMNKGWFDRNKIRIGSKLKVH